MPEPYQDMDERERVVWRWRYEAAQNAGLPKAAARELADAEVDASQIRDLLARGCPPSLIAKVLA